MTGTPHYPAGVRALGITPEADRETVRQLTALLLRGNAHIGSGGMFVLERAADRLLRYLGEEVSGDH